MSSSSKVSARRLGTSSKSSLASLRMDIEATFVERGDG
jgi:hypothetical protein